MCYISWQAINKSPANNTEACLQHEIQRLTGENFDLREKIENLNENTKRLKRLLKTYMKKLTDVGGNEMTSQILLETRRLSNSSS